MQRFGSFRVLVVLIAGCTLVGAACVSAGTSPDPSASPAFSPSTGPSLSPAFSAAIDANSSPSPSPSPSSMASVALQSAKPSASVVPPKPEGVTFGSKVTELTGGGFLTTYTVTWRTPRSEGLEVRVHGVTECVAEATHSPGVTDGPCLVEHTSLAPSVLHLAATAPASAGTVSWSWLDPLGGCDTTAASGPDGTGYMAVVLGAYSQSAHSILAIAEPGQWSSLGEPC